MLWRSNEWVGATHGKESNRAEDQAVSALLDTHVSHMLRVILVIGLATACGSTPALAPIVEPPVARPPAARSPYVAEPIAIPRATSQATAEVCSVDGRVQPPFSQLAAKPRAYEFTPEVIGPTRNPAPIVAPRRHPDAIRVAIAEEAGELAVCMQTAVAGGFNPRRVNVGGPSRLEVPVELTVDPFGAVRDVLVDLPDVKLRGCLVAAIGNARVARRTPRETVAKLALHFVGSARITKPPALRTLQPRTRRTGCMMTPSPIPRDELALEAVRIDWTPGTHGQRRERCNHELDKSEIRRTIHRHLSAFEACHAASATTAGRVDISFTIGSAGAPSEVAIKGAGDAKLHACFAAALEHLAFTRPEGPVSVTYPFELDPEHTLEEAERAIERRGAIAASDRDACEARAALITLYRADDPRALAAFQGFMAFVEKRGRTNLRACIAAAPLTAFATGDVSERHPDRFRSRGVAEALARALVVLARVPEAPPEVLRFAAAAHASLLQLQPALDAYLAYLATPGLERDQTRAAADGYANAILLRDVDSWDYCESGTPY